MKTYYYLDGQQVASLKTGDKMVIVVPFRKQPPEGLKTLRHYPDFNLLIGTDAYIPEIKRIGNSVYINGRDMGKYEGEIKKFIEESIPSITYSYVLPYPLNARVGLRETWLWNYWHGIWEYKADMPNNTSPLWCSAQCMPQDAIRYWGIVEDVRVDRVQDLTAQEMFDIGLLSKEDNVASSELITAVENWFNRRYKGKWTWEQNPYCEILMLRKENYNE